MRPASYMKIDNFYTLTVYEKGSEVIRMYHTLLGEAGFRAGTDLYFQRHDGQAVTCDDFFQAMSDANPGCDIGALKNWYSQAGTPTVICERAYDADAKTYSLTLTQVLPSTPDTGGDGAKAAQLIPPEQSRRRGCRTRSVCGVCGFCDLFKVTIASTDTSREQHQQLQQD